jgi:outer membrane biosynthesis protein TonB
MIAAYDPIQDKKERTKGIIGTILFHVILILILVLIKLLPSPIPVEEDGGGILINFGSSETGSGNEIPQSIDQSKPTPPQPTQVTPVKNDNVVTQDLEQTIAIKNQKKENKKPPVDKPVVQNNTQNTTQTEQKPQQKPKALFTGSQNNNVTSQGNTGGSGDQGDPKGNPFTNGNSQIGGGDNPLGTGGDGIGLNMTGRRITKYPNVNDNSQKTGRVVVNIKVDKNGNVIYAEATRRGSTTDDSYLFNLAVKAAYETKLNSSPDMIEQFGTMTFTFRVK